MIESQTKLPAQERGPAPIRAQGYRQPAALSRQAAGEVEEKPGTGPAQELERLVAVIRSAVQQAQLQALFSAIRRWTGGEVQARPLVNRYALHAVVIFLALGVVTVSRVRLPQISFLYPTLPAAVEMGEQTSTTTITSRGIPREVKNPTQLLQAAVFHTTIPERERTDIITYTVKANDTAWGIAQAFELQVETIMWANPEVEQDPDLLAVNQKLLILPVDGMYYTVKKGDTVDKLAKTYKTTAEKIVGLELNGLKEPYTLTAGQKLVLPDGQKPIPPRTPSQYAPLQVVGRIPAGAATGSGKFMWPTIGHWSRGMTRYHHGIDVANRVGTAIYAADAGYVTLAGWDTAGYGNQIVINHGNGFVTRYAHLSKILVKAGQSVKRGDKIALMGSTGRSTGPHLHFEIIYRGAWVNPVSYLPR